MLSHGVISGALFFCVGVIYDRMHTREISSYGGLVSKMPVYAAFFLLFTMANVGLPGTSGFVGEILTMVGAYQVEVIFGEIVNEKLNDILDVTKTEVFILGTLAFFTILLGVYPSLITDVTEASVKKLSDCVLAVRLWPVQNAGSVLARSLYRGGYFGCFWPYGFRAGPSGGDVLFRSFIQ